MKWPRFPLMESAVNDPKEAFRGIPVTVLADAMDRTQILSPDLRHVCGPRQMIGRAFTVLTLPGDNLAVFQALDAVRPGEVLVVASDGQSTATSALVGEWVGRAALQRGVAGIVVDGYVRDSAELSGLGSLSVFARGIMARGPARTSQGRLGWPVACGGVPVLTGDLVVADEDGIAVVPALAMGVVLKAARDRLEGEDRIRTGLERGEMLTRMLEIPPYPHEPSREGS